MRALDAAPAARYETLVRRRITPFLVLASSVACGAPPAPAEHAREAERTPQHEEEEAQASAPDVRSLAPDATFDALLDAARTLDDRRDQESTAGCLLRPAWRLEADLAVAVRPLPAPPDDLDEFLESEPGPVNVLSRWGAYGSGDPEKPSFSAVTSTRPPRREPAIVWAITDRGVYVRSSSAREPADPQPLDTVASSITDPASIGVLYVTAEAGTPVDRVADLLRRVPAALAGRVGVAVALAPGTRLPAPPEASDSADSSAGLCPDGLPELPGDAATGDLRPDAIVASLGPLRQAAGTCVSGTQGPGAAGGRVVLALRIGRDGRVESACATSDATNDPVRRECLLRAARATAFPAPSPPGSLDVQLPLSVAPLPSQRQTPICD